MVTEIDNQEKGSQPNGNTDDIQEQSLTLRDKMLSDFSRISGHPVYVFDNTDPRFNFDVYRKALQAISDNNRGKSIFNPHTY